MIQIKLKIEKQKMRDIQSESFDAPQSVWEYHRPDGMRAIVCNAHEGENTVRRYILISTQKQAVRNLYSLLLYGFLVPQPHVPT